TYYCCGGYGAGGTANRSRPFGKAVCFLPSTTPTFGGLFISPFFFSRAGNNGSALINPGAHHNRAPTRTGLESWDVSDLPIFGFTSGVQTLITNTTISLVAGTEYWVLAAPGNPNSDVVWNNSLTPFSIMEINSGSGWMEVGGSSAFEVLDSSS